MSNPDAPSAGPEQTPRIQTPLIYFNSFAVAPSLSDISLMIMVDGQPQARLALSFTTAKTLAEELHNVIKWFEKSTENTLLVMSDIEKAFSKAQPHE